MLYPASITEAVLDRILDLLTPLFLSVCGGSADGARDAADAMLASYEPRSNRELRFAALAIAFSFGALDALNRAIDPGLTINQVLRLRSSANALNRAAQQNEDRLQQKRPPAAAAPEPETLPDSTEPEDLMAYLRPAQEMSRQQRRLAERQAEKQRQRDQEKSRLDERVARRLAEKGLSLPPGLPPAAFAAPA